VGQPILAAAAFQAAFSGLRAGLAKGTDASFSTLSPGPIRSAKSRERLDARAAQNLARERVGRYFARG
jgi:hypothetical protein